MSGADAFAALALEASENPVRAAWPFKHQQPARVVGPRRYFKRKPGTPPRPPRVDSFPGVDIDAVHARYATKPAP